MKRDRIENLIEALQDLRIQEDRIIAQIQRELAIEPRPADTTSSNTQDTPLPGRVAHPDGHTPPKELRIGDRVRFTGTRSNPAGTGTIHSWLAAGYCWVKRDSKRGFFGSERVRRLTTNTFLLEEHE